MATTKWALDPAHSELGFKIRHLMITNVTGKFDQFEADLETEGDDFATSQIQVKIATASVNTNNTQRDQHLRNSDFFEIDRHPEILFTSTKIEKVDGENYVVSGNLTLKGISKAVNLNVEYNGLTKDPWGGQRAGFAITGKINRAEFGLSFNTALETGGFALGDEVKINAEVQFVKVAASIAA